MNPATLPEKVVDIHGDGRWDAMHERFCLFAKEKEPEVLFVGDSIIQHLQTTEMWEKMFVPLHCLNFGIGADQTQHILWRLQNGELESMSPKVVVLMAGTNNHGHSAEQVTEGVMEIVRTISIKQPQAQIVVMSIPPRGKRPNLLREKIAEINAALSDLCDDMGNTLFLNIDPSLFINPDGTISSEDMFDYLHFTKKGYQKLVEPLLDEVQTLLKNFIKADSCSTGDGPDN